MKISKHKKYLSDFISEGIVGTFYENAEEMQKARQTEIRFEKAIKRTGNRLHFKLKSYGNSFIFWINMKVVQG